MMEVCPELQVGLFFRQSVHGNISEETDHFSSSEL